MDNKIDLLEGIEAGGCSAKLDPDKLADLLKDLPIIKDNNVLVDASSFDDAGVYKLNDDTALILTTDFFPPVVSDPYTFGRIAATNAISDIYAMGAKPLMALNLLMYPNNRLPLEGLKEILRGGSDVMKYCNCLTMGGHTIEDNTPKYGLAVLGIINPNNITSNNNAKAGQVLVLTKPLGIGVALTAKRLKMVDDSTYQEAVDNMLLINKEASELMLRYGVKAATDVTGFGLIGHARNIAKASNVGVKIYTDKLPYIDGVKELLDNGCIAGAIFRNLKYLGDDLISETSLVNKYLSASPESSGGLLIAIDENLADQLVLDLRKEGHSKASIIGELVEDKECKIRLI